VLIWGLVEARDTYCILEANYKFERVSETSPVLTNARILSLFAHKAPGVKCRTQRPTICTGTANYLCVPERPY